jgi:hypothetical protein
MPATGVLNYPIPERDENADTWEGKTSHGCGNREEVAPTMPDGDDGWADDDTMRAEDTFPSGGRALALTA